MAELSPEGRFRWDDVRWPGERSASPGWAEEFFDDFTEASQREEPELRMTAPLRCRQNPDIRAVCVER